VTSRWLALISLPFSIIVFFKMRSFELVSSPHDVASSHYETRWYWWLLAMAPLALAMGVIAAAAHPALPDGSTRTVRPGRECFLRLMIAAALNFVLVALTLHLGAPVWGAWERPFYFNFIAGAIAGVTLVAIAPVIWRGKAWEIILALLFAMPPLFRLYGVYEFWQQIRWGCC
jgi:hypothetical protein